MDAAARIRRVVYVSDLSILGASVLVSTVEDILVQSAGRNLRDDMTGFLLCDGTHFAQVLEGPEAAVEACMQRILDDGRNEAVKIRIRDDARSRLFPRWSMCGLTLSDEDDAVLHPAEIGFNVRDAEPGALLQLLCGVAERHGPTLDAVHDRLLRAYGVLTQA